MPNCQTLWLTARLQHFQIEFPFQWPLFRLPMEICLKFRIEPAFNVVVLRGNVNIEHAEKAQVTSHAPISSCCSLWEKIDSLIFNGKRQTKDNRTHTHIVIRRRWREWRSTFCLDPLTAALRLPCVWTRRRTQKIGNVLLAFASR